MAEYKITKGYGSVKTMCIQMYMQFRIQSSMLCDVSPK